MDAVKTLSDSLLITSGDLLNILFSLGLAVVISVIISQLYKHTHRGMNFELVFMTTLVLLAPIVAMVMIFIRGDLVLSLGLIGSLSIIRFRTPIKDTRDMVFLFWVIAVGLGCGTYNWNIVIISTIFIALVMFILYFSRYGRSRNTDFILVISGFSPYEETDMEGVVKGYADEARVRSHEIEEDSWEIIFELHFPRLSDQLVKNLLRELKALPGIRKVSLLAPQLALPV